MEVYVVNCFAHLDFFLSKSRAPLRIACIVGSACLEHCRGREVRSGKSTVIVKFLCSTEFR